MRQPLFPCPSCHRHVRARAACPFCGAEPSPERAPRPAPRAGLSRTALLAFGAALAATSATSCGGQTVVDGSTEATGAGGGSSTAMGTGGSTTTSTTTATSGQGGAGAGTGAGGDVGQGGDGGAGVGGEGGGLGVGGFAPPYGQSPPPEE